MTRPKNKLLIGFAMFIALLNIALYIWNQSLNVLEVPYLVNTPVDRVAFDKQGRVWVSGDGKLGVYKDGQPIQVFTKEDSPVLGYPTWLLAIDNQGRAWVDSWNQESQKSELAVFDGTKLLALPAIPELVLTQILKSGITEIAFDTHGRTWIGTDTQGLYIFEEENWENYTSHNSDLLGDSVTCISFDSQGRAWIGTSGGITSVGINIFDGKGWQSFTVKNSPQFGLKIRAIAFDLQDHAWITSNGIYSYDGEKWIKVLESDDSFVDIAVDGQGRVWAMKDFDKGIMEFNGKSWRNHNFSTGKILGSDLSIDGDGNIWIPTQNGVAIISSDLERPISSLADMIRLAIASNGVIFLDIFLIGAWLYFAKNTVRKSRLGLDELPTYFESSKERIMKPSVPLKIKIRNLAIGFFGWFLICSLGFWVSELLGRGGSGVINGVAFQDPSLGLYWDYVFPVITAIAIGILFFKRRNWFAYGILVAVIINTLIWVLIYGLIGVSVGLSFPFFMMGGIY